MTNIEKFAFSRCYSLPSVAIPDSVVAIGKSAFGECTGLTVVTIGKGLLTMDIGMFSGCKNLATIAVDPLNSAVISNCAFGRVVLQCGYEATEG